MFTSKPNSKTCLKLSLKKLPFIEDKSNPPEQNTANEIPLVIPAAADQANKNVLLNNSVDLNANKNGCEFSIAVYCQDPVNKSYLLFKSTEAKNGVEIQFEKTIALDFFFGKIQRIKFIVFALVEGQNIYIGETNLELAEIVRNTINSPIYDINDKNKFVTGNNNEKTILTVSSETELESNANIQMQIAMTMLKQRITMFSKSYCFRIYRDDGKKWNFIYKSGVINRKNPIWNPFVLTMQNLCNNQPQNQVLIVVYDGKTRLGDAFFSVCNAASLQDGISIKKPSKVGGHKTRKNLPRIGKLIFTTFKVKKRYNLESYLHSGEVFYPVFAVDFTSSNGQIGSPECLHTPTSSNQYLNTIEYLWEVLRHHSGNLGAMLWGFGGINDGVQNNYIVLSSNNTSPYKKTFEELKTEYENYLSMTQFGEQKHLVEIIQNAAKLALDLRKKGKKENLIFFVLTTSASFDQKKMIEILVKTSPLPVSFVFVGIGGGDFTEYLIFQMPRKEFMVNTGTNIVRKNFTFVSFNELFRSVGETLFKETFTVNCLKDIGNQFLQYCKLKGIAPAEINSPNIVYKENNPLFEPATVQSNQPLNNQQNQQLNIPQEEIMQQPQQTFMLRNVTYMNEIEPSIENRNLNNETLQNSSKMESHLNEMKRLFDFEESDMLFFGLEDIQTMQSKIDQQDLIAQPLPIETDALFGNPVAAEEPEDTASFAKAESDENSEHESEVKAQNEAELKAEQEKAQKEAKLKAEQEIAQKEAQKEAELKAAEQEKAQKEAELKAAEQEKAQKEAELKAAEKEKAQKEAELKAEQEKAQKEAELREENLASLKKLTENFKKLNTQEVKKSNESQNILS